MSSDTPADRLAAVIKTLAAKHQEHLEQEKAKHSYIERPDFLWHHLLLSFGTMGRAAGWERLRKQENYRRITYEALGALSDEQRRAQVTEVCRAAGLRMPNRKAEYILGCFDYVRKLGGPEQAKAQLLACGGREAKIKFLDAFPGIGKKYARNIMMDVYHEEFRQSIAIDSRITSITHALGLSFSRKQYSQHEAFYLDVARRAGVNGWELDRLIFKFRREVEEMLALSSPGPLTHEEH